MTPIQSEDLFTTPTISTTTLSLSPPSTPKRQRPVAEFESLPAQLVLPNLDDPALYANDENLTPNRDLAIFRLKPRAKSSVNKVNLDILGVFMEDMEQPSKRQRRHVSAQFNSGLALRRDGSRPQVVPNPLKPLRAESCNW